MGAPPSQVMATTASQLCAPGGLLPPGAELQSGSQCGAGAKRGVPTPCVPLLSAPMLPCVWSKRCS